MDDTAYGMIIGAVTTLITSLLIFLVVTTFFYSRLSSYATLALVSQRFAQVHEFNKSGYDCVNYTNDYATVMNLLGYEAYRFDNYTELHSYNLIAVEAQEGILRSVNEG